MVQIPTTKRQFYNTAAKANTLAAYADALQPAMQNAQKIFMDQQKIKIETNATKARIEADDYVNNMRLKYQGNPDSPEFKQAVSGGLNDIFNSYGEGIDPIARGEWNITANKMMGAYDLSNNEWIINQRAQNAKLDVAEKMALDYDLAFRHGSTGNAAAGAAELDESYNNLFEYAKNNMGETEARKLLKDYNKKYMLNYLNGLMNNNPAAVEQVLNDKAIQNAIGGESQAKTLKDMAHNQALKNMRKYNQEQEVRKKYAYNQFLVKPDKTIADLEAYKENFEPDMSDAKYDRLMRTITERNDDAQTETVTDIETAGELKNLSSNILGTLGDMDSYLGKVKDFLEDVRKKQKEGKLSVEQAQNYQQLAMNTVNNPEIKQAVNNMPDFNNFTKVIPVPERKPKYQDMDWMEESISQSGNYDTYDRVFEDLRKEAKGADTDEKQQVLLQKITNFAEHVAMDNANKGFLDGDAKKLVDKAEELAKQAVFKRNFYKLPQRGYWGTFKRMWGWNSIEDHYKIRRDIDYIAKNAMKEYISLLSKGDVEGANKAYEKGMQDAIMRRYKEFIPEGTKMEPGKTILNLEGTPCMFMGFGATDICVKVND